MKTLKHIALVLAAIMVQLSAFCQVQTHEIDPRGDGKQMFNHMSIGGIVGTSGIGVDVAMPCTKYVVLRGGIDLLKAQDIRYNFATNVADVLSSLNINDHSIQETLRTTDVEIKLSPNLFNSHLIADVYPIKNSAFHLSTGFFVGNETVLTAENTKESSYKFLNQANELVHLYNETYGSNYQDVGVKFGDYIFTADKNGNIYAEAKTWIFRPYVGIGMGRPFGRTNKCSVMVDAGCMFWGAPKFKLNHEKIIKSSSNNAGILSDLQSLNFLPMIQIRIAGDLF
ncbi:MAG: hypothetical protein MJZ74_09265 [Muribaculaceae bacterium]|nr:hypothetical protein [Muribaculaceae bacterium]